MKNEIFRFEKIERNLFFTSLVEISRFWSLKMSISQAGRLERKFQCPESQRAPSNREKKKLELFSANVAGKKGPQVWLLVDKTVESSATSLFL